MKADRCVKKIEQKRSFLPSHTTVCALWRQFDPNTGLHNCLLLIHTHDMSKKGCIFDRLYFPETYEIAELYVGY